MTYIHDALAGGTEAIDGTFQVFDAEDVIEGSPLTVTPAGGAAAATLTADGSGDLPIFTSAARRVNLRQVGTNVYLRSVAVPVLVAALADLPAAAAAGAGAAAYDTTNGAPVWSSGSAWEAAAVS